jgi:hypothetical protein
MIWKNCHPLLPRIPFGAFFYKLKTKSATTVEATLFAGGDYFSAVRLDDVAADSGLL